MKNQDNTNTVIPIDDALINIYFVAMTASDIMLMRAEKVMAQRGVGLKHEIKQRHNRMMRLVRDLQAHHANICENSTGGCLDVANFESLRDDAYFITRLMLLIADRCNLETEAMVKIESYVKRMPTKGIIDTRVINSFEMRKL